MRAAWSWPVCCWRTSIRRFAGSLCRAALDRLRVIVQIPGYTSFAAAARDIYDGRDSALRQRLAYIERTAGFQVIDRSSMPLAPTPRGSDFLREATEILKFADQAPTLAT